MYNNIELQIKIGDKLTDAFQSNIGVRQGDNLSPTLFKIFINDLVDRIKDTENTHPVEIGEYIINALLYADDIVLLSTTKEGLQNTINVLKQYSDTWQLEVNLNKTKVLTFNEKRSNLANQSFYYGTQTIEQVEKYTYLGIEVTANGTFKQAMDTLQSKGLKGMYKLQHLVENDLDINTMLKIFDSTIKPIIMYGSEVWGVTIVKTKNAENIRQIIIDLENNYTGNTLELKFYKRLLRVKRNAATVGVRGELGRHPIGLYALANSLKYLQTVMNKENEKLVKQALVESQNLGETQSSWYKHVKEIEKTLNVQTPRTNTKSSVKMYYKATMKKLKVAYENEWFKQLTAKESKKKGKGQNKLRTYNQLKQNFKQETYLTNIHNTKHRKSTTQLRISAHTLHIESQRGADRTPNERICTLCTGQHMEDEYHFLMQCPIYQNHRSTLLSICAENCTNFTQLSHKQQFLWIMTNDNKSCQQELGKYLWLCFEARKEKFRSTNQQSHTYVYIGQ